MQWRKVDGFALPITLAMLVMFLGLALSFDASVHGQQLAQQRFNARVSLRIAFDGIWRNFPEYYKNGQVSLAPGTVDADVPFPFPDIPDISWKSFRIRKFTSPGQWLVRISGDYRMGKGTISMTQEARIAVDKDACRVLDIDEL